MTREFTCIICPNGCEISADYEIQADQSVVIHSLEGATCKRGAEYVKQELTDPKRILTALMRPEGAQHPVSVKTDRPVPKAKLMECAAQLYKVHPKLPIEAGDILIEDLCGTGARVIATRAAQ